MLITFGRSITKGYECGQSGSEEGKKRLIKLRDTGDDNEMVAVREEEKEEGEATMGAHPLNFRIILFLPFNLY